MKLVTLDFETYYAQDYTLRGMTTEAYVRDPRFKAHCVGIKYHGQPSIVYDCNDPGIVDILHDACDNNAVVAQKAQFDGLILSHWYGVRPKFWMDTLSMGRMCWPHQRHHSLAAMAEANGLKEKSVPYDDFKGVRDLHSIPGLYNKVAMGCADDCDLTEKMFLLMAPSIPKEEMELIDMTIRMFTEPCLKLDRPRMERFHSHLQQQKAALLQQLGVTKADLSSDAKFAAILQHLGIEVETKVTPKGNTKPAFAKNDDFMRELVDHELPHIALLAEARLDIKSTGAETRSQRFLDMDSRGDLCVYLNSNAAHTHRWGGGDSMNWQNFTRIDFDDQGKIKEFPNQRGEVRLSIMAPKDMVICVADASQIECRVLNRIAGQYDVLEKFATKRDIYSELASQFYGFEVTKKNKAERGTGKQLELSCGYGAGAATIQATAKLGIYGPPVLLSPDQSLMARNLYRSTHQHVVQLWKEAHEIILPVLYNKGYYQWRDIMHVDKGRIWFPNGTNMDYTTLFWDTEEGGEWRLHAKQGRVRMYGPKVVENVIQKIARDIVGQAMIRVKPKVRLVMTTHDEMAGVEWAEYAQPTLDFMLDELRRTPEWLPNIPLDAEGGYDVRYSK